MNKVVEQQRITLGVYRLHFESGDIIETCGQNPQVVYDLLHPAHDTVSAGNCYLNGTLMSLKGALAKINACYEMV